MFAKIQQVHFVGIGGIGMSGIAEVLLNLGYKVSGSDLRNSAVTQRLANLGAMTFEGHRAENIAGAEVVVMVAIFAPPMDGKIRATSVPVSQGEGDRKSAETAAKVPKKDAGGVEPPASARISRSLTDQSASRQSSRSWSWLWSWP